MDIQQADLQQHVVTVSGAVAAADTDTLAARLIAAVDDGGDHDLLLDMRQVTSFDDAATGALTRARSRSKYLRHRLVVLDEDGGAITRSLHRSGHALRFPVYRDVGTATAALVADREARAHRYTMDTSLPEDVAPAR
jgi:anti-anti-sigma regulatory factor